jgi:hypothetical protein
MYHELVDRITQVCGAVCGADMLYAACIEQSTAHIPSLLHYAPKLVFSVNVKDF